MPNEEINIKAKLQVDTGDIAANISKVKNELGGAGKEGQATGGMFNKLKGELGGMAGPAAAATGGIGGLNQALNILRANPIILVITIIVGLIVALAEKFSKMEKVSDALGKAWAQLSGIFDVFMENILKPLIDAFVTLVGWITDAATWIVGLFSPATAAAAKALGDLEEQMDDLNDVEAKNNITRAESNRKLQEARDAANDANIPIKDRIKFLQDAAKIEKEALEESMKLNMDRARIVLQQIGIELGVRQELIDKIREGTAAEVKAARDEIYNLDEVDKEKVKKFDEYFIAAEDQGAQLAKVSKKTEQQITSLEKEEIKARQDAAKDAADKAKAAREKAAADRAKALANLRAFEAQVLKKNRDLQLGQITEAQEKELTVLMNGYQDEVAANKRALAEKKITRTQFYTLMSADTQLFQQREAAINKKFADEAKKKDDADLKERQKKAAAELLEKNKAAASDFAILRKLSLDKINFQITQNTRDLALTKKLLNDKQAALSANFLAELLTTKKTNAEKLAMEQKYKEDIAGIVTARNEIKQKEVASTQAQVSAIGDLLSQAAEVAGKHTVAGKALAVAATAINTYQAAMGAFRGMVSTIPGPVGIALGVVAAGLAAAVGVANIKKIVSTQVPGQGSGGGSVPSVAEVPAPVTPQRSSTQLNAASIQGIGNAAAGGVNRSFVLDSDVRNNNERAARINRDARLG